MDKVGGIQEVIRLVVMMVSKRFDKTNPGEREKKDEISGGGGGRGNATLRACPTFVQIASRSFCLALCRALSFSVCVVMSKQTREI